VVTKSVAAIEALDERNSVALKGMRRNGWLHCKPEPATRQLRLARDVMPGSWLSEHPEESHRIPSRWWDLRTPKIDDETGRPEAPSWEDCGDHAKSIEDTTDLAPEQGPNEDHGLKVLKGMEVEAIGVEMEAILEPGDDIIAETLKELRPQLPQALSAAEFEGIMDEKKRKQKFKMRRHRKLFRGETRRLRRIAEKHSEFSRAQLLSALVPQAGAVIKKSRKVETV
jgi:hypothetical protein